jgi:glycosyltransferase involved in cell wall biosynthesis
MYIIHLGTSGFPIGTAAVQRIGLTFKGLKKLGYYPLIINKHSIQEKVFEKKVNKSDGIPFVFTSIIHQRPPSFVVRNFNRISGFFGEFFLLLKIKRKIDTAILYTPSFGELVYYRILSKMLGFKVIIQYVELRSSIPDRNTLLKKINDYFFDNYFHKYCDGVIAISEFLMHHVAAKNKQLPRIKIPAICDFEAFEKVTPYKGFPYIMYCGTIEYLEVIEFILDLYTEIKKRNYYSGNIILVISGTNKKNQDKLTDKLNGIALGDSISIKKGIPYSELLSLYKGADLLMIPLRNTLQDNARFPHKIGEYTAAQKTILSTNIGELKYYFTNEESAILAEEYSIAAYVSVLSNIFANNKNLNKIGENGHAIGKKNFDYTTQAKALKEFIESL